MARQRSIFGRFVQSIGNIFRQPERPSAQREPERPTHREPQRPTQRAPERHTRRPTFGPGSESNRAYHVILAGYGPVWIRPERQDAPAAKDYVINMQGFLRGGNKRTPLSVFQRSLRRMTGDTISGVLEDGTVIDNVEFETDLDTIEDYGQPELGHRLVGDGWKSP